MATSTTPVFTIAPASDGHGEYLRMVTTLPTGWGANPVVVSAAKTLTVVLGHGGANARTVTADLTNPQTAIALTTVTNPDDTLTAIFAMSGDPQGNPSHNTAHTGETCKIATCTEGIFTDDSANVSATAPANTAITNSSTLAMPTPVAGWVTVPGPHLYQGAFSIDCWADCKYPVTGIDIKVTDSAAGTETVAASVVTRAREGSCGPAAQYSVWRATFNTSGKAEGVATINMVVTDELGNTLDSAAAAPLDFDVYLNDAADYPASIGYLDPTSVLTLTPIAGEFTAGEQIATAADAWYATLLSGSGGTYTIVNGRDATPSGTVTGKTSGATGTYVSNVLNAADSATLNDRNTPSNNLNRIINAMAAVNNAAGLGLQAGNGTIYVMSSHFRAMGPIDGPFWTASANTCWLTIRPDPTNFPNEKDCFLDLGSTGFRDNHMNTDNWKIQGVSINPDANLVGSAKTLPADVAATVWLDDVEYIGEGQSVQPNLLLVQSVSGQICWTRSKLSDQTKKGSMFAGVGSWIRDSLVADTIGDVFNVSSAQTRGLSCWNLDIDNLEGTAAGEHSDVIQSTEGGGNFAGVAVYNLRATNIRYQNMLFNATSATGSGVAMANVLIECVDDADVGSLSIRFDQILDHVVTRNASLISPTTQAPAMAKVDAGRAVTNFHATNMWATDISWAGATAEDVIPNPLFSGVVNAVSYSDANSDVAGQRVTAGTDTDADWALTFTDPWKDNSGERGNEYPMTSPAIPDWSPIVGGPADGVLTANDIQPYILYDIEGVAWSVGGPVGALMSVAGGDGSPWRRFIYHV